MAKSMMFLILLLAAVRATYGEDLSMTFTMNEEGYFIQRDGTTFYPLGGMYGNRPQLVDEESLYGHANFQDGSENQWRQYFQALKENGVNALRMFPRAHVTVGDSHGADEQLDIGGMVNPHLFPRIEQYMEVAGEYGIKFQFILFSEPRGSVYRTSWKDFLVALPIYKEHGFPFNRFIGPDKEELRPIKNRVEYFTDKEVFEHQVRYMKQLIPMLDLSRIFAFELYNEQGWGWGTQENWNWDHQGEESAWSEKMARVFKSILPDAPLCISHPGWGITGYDPLHWLQGTPSIDFYSSHYYATIAGESKDHDFGSVPGLIAKYVKALKPCMSGESGILDASVPVDLRTLALRDNIWLSITSGAPGHFQWQIERQSVRELKEYLFAARILKECDVGRWQLAKAALVLDLSEVRKNLAAFRTREAKMEDSTIHSLFLWDRFCLDNCLDYRCELDVSGERGSIVRPDVVSPKDIPIDEENRGPIRVEGSYQGRYLMENDGRRFIAYLRNYSPVKYEKYFLRRQKETCLKASLTNEPETYRIDLCDLDTGERTTGTYRGSESFIDDEDAEHDFLVIAEKVE